MAKRKQVMSDKAYQGYINRYGKTYRLVSRKIMLRGGKERPIYYFKPCESKLATYETEREYLPEEYEIFEDKRNYPRVIKRGISENN